MTGDRIGLNTPETWRGPDFALGMVDEVVLSAASLHLEMLDDNAAFLGVVRDGGELLLTVYARPTSWRERRQIVAHRDDRLVDHLAGLVPERWGGRTLWSNTPWWQRPVYAITDWWAARRASRAVLCIRCDENDLIPEEAS